MILLLFPGMQYVYSDIRDDRDIALFLEEMVNKHGFEQHALLAVLDDAQISESILEAISRPAETLPWYKYRNIFLRQDRMRQGVDFMRSNRQLLEMAERKYGVPAEIITAIIGVETRYGRNVGSYRVIDALVTLGFRYPKRGAFFRKELEEFLLLTREQGLDPLSVVGSYAGAMGIPQFISSSYRHYAVDFDRDGRIDIWKDNADAIGSVANYLSFHGWERGGEIAVKASAGGDDYLHAMTEGLEPDISVRELEKYGITANLQQSGENRKVKLLSLETEESEELWLGFKNFYAITRYNHSALYAMAVFLLAEEIVRLSRR